MSQPDPYNRVTSFAAYQTDNPTDPLPGQTLDAELNAVKVTLDQIRQNLALIQRDDGELGNQTVGVDQLSPEITVGFEAPTLWATATNYTVASTVFQSGKFYSCLIAHVSGVFATDLAAGKWSLIADLTSIVATITDLQAVEISVASASTTPIGVQTTFRTAITGSTTITRFDAVPNRVRFVRFTGSLTIIYDPVYLVLPNALNIVTAPGEWAIFSSDTSGYWTCEFYSRPLFPAGAVGAPGLAFQGDADTGLYSPGANQLAIAVGGANAITFTGSGATSAVAIEAPSITQAGSTVWSTGDAKLTLKQVADPGWLMMDDTTIGSASSSATHKGSQYQALYGVLWALSDTYAPVTGGRGANAAADWAANKPIALTKQLGRSIIIAGAGAGLTSRALGETFGAENTTLAQSNLPNVTLTFSSSGTFYNVSSIYSVDLGATSTVIKTVTAGTVSGNTSSINGGVAQTSFSRLDPSTAWNIMIKL